MGTGVSVIAWGIVVGQGFRAQTCFVIAFTGKMTIINRFTGDRFCGHTCALATDAVNTAKGLILAAGFIGEVFDRATFDGITDPSGTGVAVVTGVGFEMAAVVSFAAFQGAKVTIGTLRVFGAGFSFVNTTARIVETEGVLAVFWADANEPGSTYIGPLKLAGAYAETRLSHGVACLPGFAVLLAFTGFAKFGLV